MPISPEMKKEIDKKIDAVDYKRSSKLSIAQIMDRYARLLPQIDIDKEALILSGLDWEMQPYFEALLVYLYEVHADRVAAEGKGPGHYLKMKMPKFNFYHTILTLVLKYCLDKTNNENLIALHRKVKQGNSKFDTLHDILAMSVILRDFIHILEKYTPQGVQVDEAYLDQVSSETENLLCLTVEANNRGSIRGRLVEKQRRLIVLIREAIDNIRMYAEAAFCMEMNYFRKHYTIHDFRRGNVQSVSEEAPEDSRTPSEEPEK